VARALYEAFGGDFEKYRSSAITRLQDQLVQAHATEDGNIALVEAHHSERGIDLDYSFALSKKLK